MEIVDVDAQEEGHPGFGDEIPMGMVFRGRIGFEMGVFLRAYGVVVSLDRPSQTWTALHHKADVDGYEELHARLYVSGAPLTPLGGDSEDCQESAEA